MALSLAFGLFGLVCYAAIQLALQLQQERVQVVRSTKVVRRIPTKSNGTLASDACIPLGSLTMKPQGRNDSLFCFWCYTAKQLALQV